MAVDKGSRIEIERLREKQEKIFETQGEIETKVEKHISNFIEENRARLEELERDPREYKCPCGGEFNEWEETSDGVKCPFCGKNKVGTI